MRVYSTFYHPGGTGGGIARYSFTTTDGSIIENGLKCWDLKEFNENYEHMQIIYNSADPLDYQNYADFKRYTLSWSIVYYFGLYAPVLFILLLKVVSVVQWLYYHRRGN